MRVLLISENRCMENLIPFPLGIASVAASVAAAGHEVRGLDLMFSDDPCSDVALAVREFSPHCVGLSIRNIDNQDMHSTEFYLPPLRQIIASIRAETEAPVVTGGSGFSIFPIECMEYLDLEMGVVGEGEEAFPLLLGCLETGSDPSLVGGVALRQNGRGAVNRPGPPPDMDTLAPPDRETFDVRLYNRAPGDVPPYTANLQSRRGCHMSCIYCSTPMVEGRRVRFRRPSKVADELETLDGIGIRNAVFTDSLFNYPTNYTARLCREIAERKLAIGWSASFNPACSDPGLFPLMSRAGCHTLSIGNESGSEQVLSALRKGFSRDDVVKAVSAARDAGIKVMCFLMFGGPGENRSTVDESVALLDDLEPDSVRVTVGIRIYPGCELHRTALREGVVAPGQNLLFPAFYVSPGAEPWLYEHVRSLCDGRAGWAL